MMASRKTVSPSELESSRPPTNLYTPEFPHTVTLLSIDDLKTAPLKTYHVVFDHQGFLPHWEGQQFGVMLAPADNPFEHGNAEELQGFSVASTRYGDLSNGMTVSLCVRSFPDTLGEKICKAEPGDKFQFTGPNREAMLLGDYGTNASHIFVATGTAVAPFRAHLFRLFNKDMPTFPYSNFNGLAWLFVGVANSNRLYDDEFQQIRRNYSNNFKYQVQENENGTEEVAEAVIANIRDIFDRLQNGAYIYFAGFSGMETNVKRALQKVAVEKHLDWLRVFAKWKANGQWRVEVHA